MEVFVNSGSVDIRKLFVDVVDKGIPHCRICYRTSREVKLVQPEKLLQLASQLKQQYVFGSAALDKSACIICEGAASAALRLTDAIFNAATIKGIMQTYSGFFFNKSVINKSHIAPCEKLIAYRDRTTYKQTEVLIVDSLGLEWSNKSNGTDKGPTRVDLTDVMRDHPPTLETVVLDDDDDSAKLQNVKPTPTPDSDTIAIINNPIKVPTLVPINFLLNNVVEKTKYAAMVPNKMQLITGHESAGDNFVLHEVVMQKNGTLTVPGLACEIKDGCLIYNPKLLDTYNLLQQAMNNSFKTTSTQASSVNTVQTEKYESMPKSTNTPKPLPEANKRRMIPTKNSSNNTSNNVIQQQNVLGMDETKNGRFLGTQSLNNTKFNADSTDTNCISIIDVKGSSGNFDSQDKETIEMVEIDNILSKHIEKRKNDSKRTDTSKKPRKELLVNLNINNCLASDHTDVIAVISDVTSQAEPSVNKAVESEQGASEKRPIEKGGRIDWEDKIPMDVISYMDATDPNAELIVPDSLSIDPDVNEEGDVIDLC